MASSFVGEWSPMRRTADAERDTPGLSRRRRPSRAPRCRASSSRASPRWRASPSPDPVLHHLHEPLRDDLPGHAVSVLEPAAHALLTTLGEPGPVVVHLVLVVAEDLERDGFGERVLRPSVQPEELLAVQLELDANRARLSELRVLEDRGVVVRRLFCLPVEP